MPDRRWISVILVLSLAACQRGREASEPPVRYQADATAAVAFVDDQTLAATCDGAVHEAGVSVIACERAARIYLPNPCRWPGADPYAELACHELGHANGWPANHPK